MSRNVNKRQPKVITASSEEGKALIASGQSEPSVVAAIPLGDTALAGSLAHALTNAQNPDEMLPTQEAQDGQNGTGQGDTTSEGASASGDPLNEEIIDPTIQGEHEGAKEGVTDNASVEALNKEISEANDKALSEREQMGETKEAAALKEILLEVLDETKTTENFGIPRIAAAVSAFLNVRQEQAGKVQLVMTFKDIRDYCYDLADYRTKNDAGVDTSCPSFEAIVRRGAKAGILLFNEQFGLIVHEGRLKAPEKHVMPVLKVQGGVKGGTKEIANLSQELVDVPIRLIEEKYEEAYPEHVRRKATRAAHHNTGSNSAGNANLPTITTGTNTGTAPGSKASEGTGLEVDASTPAETILAKAEMLLKAYADGQHPLPETVLTRLVNLGMLVDQILTNGANIERSGWTKLLLDPIDGTEDTEEKAKAA